MRLFSSTLYLVGVLLALGPVYGMFMTMRGMILAFHHIAEQGYGSPELLSERVGEALLWTALGYGFLLLSWAFLVPAHIMRFRHESASSETLSEKSYGVFSVLLLLLGPLGAHRLYVGKVLTGILMLGLAFCSLVASAQDVFPMASLAIPVLTIWVIHDIIRTHRGRFEDPQMRPIRVRPRQQPAPITLMADGGSLRSSQGG